MGMNKAERTIFNSSKLQHKLVKVKSLSFWLADIVERNKEEKKKKSSAKMERVRERNGFICVLRGRYRSVDDRV